MKKHMLKKILSILLALALFATTIPAFTLPVQATEAAGATGDIGDQNALDALGIDTSVMPEGYDANSLDNPYGRSTLALNPVYELFETHATAGTPTNEEITITTDGGIIINQKTKTTPYTVSMSLYGHNASLKTPLKTIAITTNAAITQAIVTTKTISPAGIDVTYPPVYTGADRVLSATTSASGNFSTDAGDAGKTGQVVTVGTESMSPNGGLYLYFTDPVTGQMSPHMKTLIEPTATIGNFGGKMDENFSLAPYLMQNYLKVATGDYDGNGIDEVAVYIAEQGASRVEVYKLETTSSAGDGFFLDETNWRRAWTYYFNETPYVSNMVSLTSGDFSRDGIDDLAMTWGYYYGPEQKNGTRATVLYGDNQNMLQAFQDISLMYETSPIVRAAFTFGDIDGDGVKDLVLGGQLETDILTASIGLNSRFVAVYTYQGPNQPFLQTAAQNFNLFQKENNQYVNQAMAANNNRFYSSPAMVANVAVFNTEGIGRPISIYLDSLIIENGDNGLVISKALDQDTGFRRYPTTEQKYYAEYGAMTSDFSGAVKQSLQTMQYYLPATRTDTYSNWIWFWFWSWFSNDVVVTTNLPAMLDKVLYTSGDTTDRTSGVDFSTSYCALNTDNDTSLLKYLNKHYVRYTDPKVLAVLSSPPYFKDLDQDGFSGGYTNSETTYSTSTGTGSGDSTAHTLSLGVYVSFSHEFTMPVTGVKLGSLEAEASYTAGLTWETEHSASLEQTISYSTLVGEDAVAFYSVPMEIYEYESLMPIIDDSGNITGYDVQKMAVNIPHIASVKVLPLDTYEKIAADYRELPRIAGQVLNHTVGDPATYPSSTSAYRNPIQYTGDWSGVNFGNGSISQSIAMTNETGKSFTHTHNIEFKVGVGPGDFVFGRSIGYEFGSGRTKVTTEGSSFTGTIYNMPPEAEPYGYNYVWKVFSYEADIDGTSFPVVDYLVTDVTAPPELPTDFQQNPAGTTDDQIELNWSYKGSVAGFQLYRYYEFPDGSGSYELAFVPMSSAYATDSDGTRHFRYVDASLDPYTDYDYQIQTVRAAVPNASILSEVYRARTKTGTGYPVITLSGPNDAGILPVYPDTDSTARVQLANASVYEQAPRYQWQKQTADGWMDISGATADNHVFRSSGLGDEGIYRCRVNVIYDAQYISSYSNTFFLDYSQRTAMVVPGSFSAQDTTTNRRPTLSISLKSAHTDHFYVPTGTLTFQLRGAGGDDYQYPVPLQPATGEASKTGTAIASFVPESDLPAGPYEVTAYYNGSRVYQSLAPEQALYWVSGGGSGYMLMLDNAFTYGNTMSPTLYEVQKTADNTTTATIINPATVSWHVDTHVLRYEPFLIFGLFRINRLVNVTVQVPGFFDASSGSLIADQVGTYTLVASQGGNSIASRQFEVKPRDITIGITNQDKEAGLDTVIHPGIDILNVKAGSLAPADDLSDLGLYVRAANTAGNEVTISNATLPGRYAITGAATADAYTNSEYENYNFQFDAGSYILTGPRYAVSGLANKVNEKEAGTLTLSLPITHTDWTTSPRFANGTDLFFQATPLAGYSVKRWAIYDLLHNTYLLEEETHRTTLSHLTRSEDIRVSVDFEVTQSRLSYQATAGGTITCSSSDVFQSGDVARNGAAFTFKAIPSTGYHFVEWQLTEVGRGLTKPAGTSNTDGSTTCDILMGTGDTVLHAIFERDPYLLTLNGALQATYLFDVDGKSSTPDEPVTVGSGVRIPGDKIITVTHKPGYQIPGDAIWKKNGVAVTANTGTDNQSYTFTMQSDTTITVRTENERYPVALTITGPGNGVNTVAATSDAQLLMLPTTLSGGAVLRFEATPAYGYIFDKWILTQTNTTSTGTTVSSVIFSGSVLNVPALGGSLSVEAVFRDNDSYNLTLRHGKRGKLLVTVNESTPREVNVPDTNTILKVFKGDTVSVTAVPDRDFMLEYWRIGGSVLQTYIKTQTFSNVSAPLSVEAVFGAQSYTTVTYSATPGGDGSLTATSDGVPFHSGSNSVGKGSTVRFFAVPNADRMVDGWTLNSIPVRNAADSLLVDAVYEIPALAGTANVQATFRDVVTHTVTYQTAHAAITCLDSPQWPGDGIRDGAAATFTVLPDAGFRVISMTAARTTDGVQVPLRNLLKRDDGAWTSMVNAMTSNLTVTAEAVELYDLNIPTVPAGGNVLLSAVQAIAGETVTLNAIPETGFTFSGWTVSGGVTLSDATEPITTFTMPASDVNVAATFTAIPTPTPTPTPTPGPPPGPAPVPPPAVPAPADTDAIYTYNIGQGRVTPENSQLLVGTNSSQSLSLEGNGFQIRIPMGTLQPGDDLNDFIPNLAGLNLATGNGWVVVRTDAAGVEHIISWSSVHSGNIAFLADDRGVYSLVNNEKTFDDIEGHWGFEAIAFVTSRELFQGTGPNTFDASATMTRAMLVTVLHRLDGLITASGSSFSDVPRDSWYADAVAWAAANKITTGTGDGSFGAMEELTREQLAVFLFRYADMLGLDTSSTKSLDNYADDEKITDYSLDAIRWAVENGIIKGKTGGLLDPSGITNRAEVSTMIQRFIELTLK